MSLRVEDLKPGDVVRMELTVRSVNGGKVWVQHYDGRHDAYVAGFTSADLAAGNAELVVRPRPVRKGETVRHDNGSLRVFVAQWRDGLLCGSMDRPNEPECLWSQRDLWTHADGSPIDWEGSE